MAPTWLQPFDPAFRDAVQAVLDDPGPAPLACFDADGTLWSEDIGEAFLRWLIAGHLLPNHDCAKDVYADYEARVEVDRAEGYAWAVRLMAGLPVEDVVRWSRQLAHAWPCYRPAMADLARGLAAAGVEVWIVSATNRWTVTEGGRLMGFAPERVIGMSVEVADGRLTDRAERPLIANAGKVEAIGRVIGRRPDLAFGDSKGDFEMLCDARQPLVVGRRDKPASLLPIAAERGWPIHLF